MNMDHENIIPIVDISVYGLGERNADTVLKEEVQGVADQVCRALTGVGFCYISNHGLPEILIDEVMTSSREFFEQSDENKNKYARPADKNHGWIALEREQVNPDRPGDLKEAYNYAASDDTGHWPDYSEKFETSVKSFYHHCQEITLRMLDLMSIGLRLPSSQFLRDRHNLIGKVGNPTTMRCLFYPSVRPDSEIKPGQIRCGEHTDYGSLTLLFQDDIGGLEVKNTHGDFIPATPVPGAILMNIGDLMQRWTADRLKATNHRVVIPENEKRGQCRQSVAFFVHPDDDVIISCLDNSDKYPPITSKEYLLQKLRSTITGVI